MPVLTDHVRRPDTDNPRGYYELECVKRLAADPAWLDEAEGKALKVISALLKDLPSNRRYKVIFMLRNLNEVLDSQAAMLKRRNRESETTRGAMRRAFRKHLRDTQKMLLEREFFDVCFCSYRALVRRPRAAVLEILAFLDGRLDGAAMEAAVEPRLYRQRRLGFLARPK